MTYEVEVGSDGYSYIFQYFPTKFFPSDGSARKVERSEIWRSQRPQNQPISSRLLTWAVKIQKL